VYVCCPPGPDFAQFHEALTVSGLLWRQNLVWVKNAMVLGRSDFHYQHETDLVWLHAWWFGSVGSWWCAVVRR